MSETLQDYIDNGIDIPASGKIRALTAEGHPIYRVPEWNMDALMVRVEKMNRRAKKLGMAPLVVALTGEDFEERSRKRGGDTWDSESVGKWEKYTIRLVLLTLTGECPRVNGWAMAATIQHDEGGNILRTVPGFEACLPLEYRRIVPRCDHCHTVRQRNDTYVLQSLKQCPRCYAGSAQWSVDCKECNGSGYVPDSWKQVGRNCLSDFLRTSDASGLAEYAEMLAGLDDEMGAFEDDGESCGGRGREYFKALRLLTQVACCVRADGWCSRTEAKNSFVGKCATVDAAMSLWDSKLWDKLSDADREKLTPTAEDAAKAEAAIAWAQALPEDVTVDYLWNIRVVSHRELISYREAGLAGSIIAAYNRHLEQEMKKKYERDTPSEHFGVIGERAYFVLTVMGTREMDGNFGLTTLVSFRDERGSRCKWFCSGSTELEVDKTYTVRASIKEHQIYHERKETLLSRVTVASEEELMKVEKKRARAEAKRAKAVAA
jgi:hypothetical protein